MSMKDVNLQGGVEVLHGGLYVKGTYGWNISSGGLVISSDNSTKKAALARMYLTNLNTASLPDTYTAMEIRGYSTNPHSYLWSNRYDDGNVLTPSGYGDVFTLRSSGRVDVFGGLRVTGGVSVTPFGMRVAGGSTVVSGGIRVSRDGAQLHSLSIRGMLVCMFVCVFVCWCVCLCVCLCVGVLV